MNPVNNIFLKNKTLLQYKTPDEPAERISLHSDYQGIELPDLYQKIFMHHLFSDKVEMLFCLGTAGTGKTFLTMYYLLDALSKKEFGQAVLTKPLISVNQSNYMGTLPGDIEDKISPFAESFKIAAYNLQSMRKYEKYVDEQRILFQPIDFIRGNSYENTLLIVDEVQNLTKHEFITICTRVGRGSKVVFLGDPNQIDLGKGSDKFNVLDFVRHTYYKEAPFTAFCLLERNMRSKIVSLVEDIYYEDNDNKVTIEDLKEIVEGC